MQKHILSSPRSAWLLLLLLTLFACRKDPDPDPNYNWEFSGRILEKGSDQPVPNAVVRMRLCESEFLGPVSCYTIKTDTTDAEGRYTMQHRSDDLILNIDAIADDYYELPQEFYLDRGEEKGFDIRLIAKSQLRLTFRNERDSVVYFSYQVDNYYFPQVILNQHKDTTILFELGGGIINWWCTISVVCSIFA